MPELRPGSAIGQALLASYRWEHRAVVLELRELFSEDADRIRSDFGRQSSFSDVTVQCEEQPEDSNSVKADSWAIEGSEALFTRAADGS